MTIHSEFWKSRNVIRSQVQRSHGFRYNEQRDSNRQRCYNWEFETLRPYQAKFEDRQAAKGFARLCSKVALKLLAKRFPNADHEAIRASFKAAFTKEAIQHCNAAEAGAYFAAFGWTNVIIAHEVAHWADMWEHILSKRTAFEGHGPRWRGWFVHILSDVCPRLHPSLMDDTKTIMRRNLSERRLTIVLP